MKERKHNIELMKEDVEASWAWFLDYYNESTMIASKKTNSRWFREWGPYFDIKKIKILKPRQKTEKSEVLKINKKYIPSFKEKEEAVELNNKILSLIKQEKNRKEICKELKINEQKLGHRISKLKNNDTIKIIITEKKIDAPYPSPIKKYRLNFKPFFDYAKTKNIEFNESEMNSIKLLFYTDVSRTSLYEEYKTISYIEAIPKYFLKHFYLPLLEEKNKFNYSKETINFLLGGGGQLKDIGSLGSLKKVLKEMDDTLYDESDWNPLENLKKIDDEVISKVNLKMLKILSN